MRVENRLGNVSIMIVAGLLLSGAALTSTPPSGAQEVTVVGVFVDPDSGSRVVMLEGKRDKRTLAMVIGAAEATGIAVGLHNMTPPRPLTHDLFLTVFGRLNVAVDKVMITDLREHTYYATLFLKSGGAVMELDSRPSDAIALALRAKAPVYATDVVLDKAGQRPGAPASSGQRI